MIGFDKIFWHDSQIESVIEIPSKDLLIYNISYPDDWANNIFTPKHLVFEGYNAQEVNEMPFEGNPTILSVSLEKSEQVKDTIKIETNAGYRKITAYSVAIKDKTYTI